VFSSASRIGKDVGVISGLCASGDEAGEGKASARTHVAEYSAERRQVIVAHFIILEEIGPGRAKGVNVLYVVYTVQVDRKGACCK